MATRRKSSPGTPLQLGASVLSAARLVDTRLVKDRLGRFVQMHRTYVAAQRKVDAAEAELRAAEARVTARDAAQDHAVEALAAALAGEGHTRRNPFETFGASPPSVIMRLPFTEEPAAVHQLVAAIERSKTASVSKATLKAAQAADKAASAVEEALGPLAELEEDVRHVRRTRDSVVPGWESALAALRRGARAAADEGATDLYTRLFPPVVRAAPKTKPAEDQPPAATQTPNAA
jgi:hypothetical protein